MTYEEWERKVPEVIREDSLWKMAAYRLALFLADLGWYDVTKLVQNRRTIGLSGQLYEALCSVSANIAEGYSRGTSKDRARFYEYALGSARESRDWYFKSRHFLGEKVVQHRLQLLTETIRLLLTMVPQQRNHHLREESFPYQTGSDTSQSKDLLLDKKGLGQLLEDIPLPLP
jgi:four helix bundle protein